MRAARYELVGGNTFRWYVASAAGHDGFPNALGLLALAAQHAAPPHASLWLRPRPRYANEGRY